MILGGSTCAPITFLLVDQSHQILSLNVGGAVVDHMFFFLIFDISVRSLDIHDRSLNLTETAPNLGCFWPPKFFGSAVKIL